MAKQWLLGDVHGHMKQEPASQVVEIPVSKAVPQLHVNVVCSYHFTYREIWFNVVMMYWDPIDNLIFKIERTLLFHWHHTWGNYPHLWTACALAYMKRVASPNRSSHPNQQHQRSLALKTFYGHSISSLPDLYIEQTSQPHVNRLSEGRNRGRACYLGFIRCDVVLIAVSANVLPDTIKSI